MRMASRIQGVAAVDHTTTVGVSLLALGIVDTFVGRMDESCREDLKTTQPRVPEVGSCSDRGDQQATVEVFRTSLAQVDVLVPRSCKKSLK